MARFSEVHRMKSPPNYPKAWPRPFVANRLFLKDAKNIVNKKFPCAYHFLCKMPFDMTRSAHIKVVHCRPSHCLSTLSSARLILILTCPDTRVRVRRSLILRTSQLAAVAFVDFSISFLGGRDVFSTKTTYLHVRTTSRLILIFLPK